MNNEKCGRRRVPPPVLLELSALAHLPDEQWLFQLRQPTEADAAELHVSYALFVKGFARFQTGARFETLIDQESFSARSITFHVPAEAMSFLAQHLNNFEQMAAQCESSGQQERRCKQCGRINDLNQCACHYGYWWCKRCLIEHIIEQVSATGTRRNANAHASTWDDAADALRFAAGDAFWAMGRGGPFAWWHSSTSQTSSSNPSPPPQQQQAKSSGPKRKPITPTVREALGVLGVPAQDGSETPPRPW